MDTKEALIEAAAALIEDKCSGDITVREICAKAGVATGLLNYHFGSRQRLIEICVERIVNGIVDQFSRMREKTAGSPFERLEKLGLLTLTYLFEHEQISRISILSDMRSPAADDNTQRTYRAYVPLVAACRPDLSEEQVRQRTFSLIAAMQQAFLRPQMVQEETGWNLRVPSERAAWHRSVLRSLIGEEGE